MKRMVSFLLAAALLFGLLSACREPAPSVSSAPAKDWTVSELAELALEYSGREDQDGLEGVDAEMDQEWIAAYLENAYGLEEPWEDAAVIRATGASAFEIAVLRMEDESAAVRAATALMSYIYSRQGDFAGYAPAEADMAARGSIMQDGPFAALFICPDPERAYEAVEAALSGVELSSPEDSEWKVEAEVGAMLDYLLLACGYVPENLERLNGDNPDALSAYIEGTYGLEHAQWEEAAIAHATAQASAFEVAVLKVKDADAVWDVADVLLDYLDERIAFFDGRDPDQAEMLRKTAVYRIVGRSIGTYVVLPICDSPMQAAALGYAMGADTTGSQTRCSDGKAGPQEPEYDPDYPDRIKFVQPKEDDMSLYDTSDIRTAWENGDPSGLSQYDRDIYDQAKKVLDQVLENGMSDYEKELAVYNWVVNNVDYDWTHQDRMKETPRESFTPYGGLVNHTAVCLGYATTFQLLMDMAGVECITVPGAAFESGEDHGWNMVRLNGEWYCVDVTWDANNRELNRRGQQEDWDYFNVTSDYMASRDHQWDYANTPEATARDEGRD